MKKYLPFLAAGAIVGSLTGVFDVIRSKMRKIERVPDPMASSVSSDEDSAETDGASSDRDVPLS